MENFIIVALILIIIGLPVLYIIRAKRKGSKCIGCPYSSKCSADNGCCHSENQEH